MRGEVVEARAAPVQVVARGAAADQAHHQRYGDCQGRSATPAAWPMRQEPKDLAIAALAGAADGQEVVPERFIPRIGRWLHIAHACSPSTARRPSPLASRTLAAIEAIFLPLSILQAV